MGASIILQLSLLTGMSCEKSFAQTAEAQRRREFLPIEKKYIKSLAQAACKTDNPDLIWEISNTESGFRFLLVRINPPKDSNKKFKILEQAEAVEFLTILKHKQKKINVDIGVMQMNWRFHGEQYQNDPLKMLSPNAQVNYLVKSMQSNLMEKCGDMWIGCYHNQNQDLAYEYIQKIISSEVSLSKSAQKVLKKYYDKDVKVVKWPQKYNNKYAKIEKWKQQRELKRKKIDKIYFSYNYGEVTPKKKSEVDKIFFQEVNEKKL